MLYKRALEIQKPKGLCIPLCERHASFFPLISLIVSDKFVAMTLVIIVRLLKLPKGCAVLNHMSKIAVTIL